MVALPTAIDYGAHGLGNGSAAPAIGSRAPRLDGLRGTDGQTYSLADFADKEIVVLIFSSNRCPTAKSHSERLQRFQAEYGPRGVQLVLVNSNDAHLYPEESFERMVSLAREAEYSFPYLADPDQRVARLYGPTHTFHAFVLDRRRRLRYQGRFDDARVAANVTSKDVANAVDDLLAGRDVQVAETVPFGCSLDIVNGSGAEARLRLNSTIALWIAIALAWLAMVAAQMSGLGALLHHGALIESGPPLPVAAAMSTAGWLVMTVGMMLPASMRAVGSFGRDGRIAGFLAAYVGVWAAFGLLCFAGDSVLHRAVDSTPWLAQHAYLIAAGVLAMAGAYQFSPLKGRCLAACRNPLIASHRGHAAVAAGAAHAIDCVLSSGPLMLLMFAAGIANLWWMAALTALMAYETVGRQGRAVARAAGVVLLFAAVLAVTTPGVAAILAD